MTIDYCYIIDGAIPSYSLLLTRYTDRQDAFVLSIHRFLINTIT